MKPLTPKLKEALLLWKTPREALTKHELGSCSNELEDYGLAEWVAGDSSERFILTPSGVKAWKELQEQP